MCFTFKLNQPKAKIEQRFKAKSDGGSIFQPFEQVSGFSYPLTPVITHKNRELIQDFYWGLIPSWSKDKSIRQYTLNAKIETLYEKPSFKPSLLQRCLIPADGFYEWQWQDSKGKNKDQYLITLNDNELFAFAGLWARWQDPVNKEELHSYTIVTTTANALMSEIHNTKQRMPVILTPENEEAWLKGEDFRSFARPDIALKAKNMSGFGKLF